MIKTILFVHGTGVREESYWKTAAKVAAGLKGIESKAALRPCSWGETLGARLALGGISIPDFEGEVEPGEDVKAYAALWQLLAADPLYELRELAGRKPADLVPPKAQALALAFPGTVAGLATLDTALELLDGKVLAHYWPQAVAAVAGSDALRTATTPPLTVDGVVRVAAGRALAARLQATLVEDNFPALDTALRDALADAATTALGGRDKNLVTDWVTERLKDMALGWATAKARRERDVLYTAAYPAAGDILLYQADGDEIRKRISRDIDDCGEDTAVIAHSLGGIACVDLLVDKPHPNVKLLVTCGSQAPLLYELGALRKLKPKAPLPAHFPRTWLNFFDRNDLLSYKAAPVFKGADRDTRDIEIASGQPFPDSHSAYWNQSALWTRLKPYLA